MKFSEELKEKTKDVHSSSDKLFNSVLSFALADRNVYRMAVLRFYHVFSLIENKIEDLRHDCPILQTVYLPTLFRANEFEDDVLYFYAGDIPTEQSSALEKYRQAMETHVAEDPINIIAYLQTMQMAILAGGSLLRPIIVKVLGLRETFPLGVKALTWPEGFSTSAVKKVYNQRIDELELSREQKDRIISIKREVFSMNNVLIREVTGSEQSKTALIRYLTRLILVVIAVILIAYSISHFALK